MITTINFLDIGNIFLWGIITGVVLTCVLLVVFENNLKKR